PRATITAWRCDRRPLRTERGEHSPRRMTVRCVGRSVGRAPDRPCTGGPPTTGQERSMRISRWGPTRRLGDIVPLCAALVLGLLLAAAALQFARRGASRHTPAPGV